MPAASSRLLGLTLLATCIATAWGQNANLPDCPCPPTSYRGLQCNPVPCDCATLAVRYGIKAHNDWGSAPGGVRTYWDSQDCNDLVCEQIRTKFGVVPGSSWGSAPANVQDIWLNTNGNCDHGGACVGRGIDCSRSARAGIVETVKDFKLSFCKTFDEDAKTDICVSDENGNPLMPSDNMVAGSFKVTTDLDGTKHSYEVVLDQQCASTSDAQRQLSGWVVKSGTSGVYYLHQESSLVVQNLGAARVAMQVLSQINEGMLVEPLLPRAWRKELDKQKTLKGDVDTDLYAVGIGEQHLAHSCSEEGTVVDDGFVVPEGPRMAKLCIKMQEISDALDLVPQHFKAIHEQCVRHARKTYIAEAFCKTLHADFAETQLYQPHARLRPADHKRSGAAGRRDVSFPCGTSTLGNASKALQLKQTSSRKVMPRSLKHEDAAHQHLVTLSAPVTARSAAREINTQGAGYLDQDQAVDDDKACADDAS
ncbi:hypothetical protein ABBQ32_009725 [Trebouxia sp. C0010 RCD-2024]